MLARGGVLRLAGGARLFGECELVVRAPGAIRVCRWPIGRIRRWSEREGGVTARSVASLLERLTAPRAPFAGLALDRPRLMGVLNVTPDSFSDGGEHLEPGAAIRRALEMREQGADIVDVGGESTRPGSEPTTADDELARILPVVRGLAGRGVPISIDTRRAQVMAAALEAGASAVNDVSALEDDPASLPLVAAKRVCVILMHKKGDPATMNVGPRYDNALLDVYDHLERRVAACVSAGLPRDRIAVDPGLGFGKTSAHNLEVIRGLALYHGLGTALVIGTSRKGLTRELRRAKAPRDRLAASLAWALAALDQGAQLLRVHDVAESAEAVAAWRALGGAL
ncbi:MAG: dihydropteroate synthase [Alphaproteobacteria bacterium]